MLPPFYLQYIHQSYCWQVALQQSLLPLRIDKAIKEILLRFPPTIFDHITDYFDFWIGEIESVTDKSISIHNYNPDGLLYEKPSTIKLDTINTITFGDNYSTVFRKYLKHSKK